MELSWFQGTDPVIIHFSGAFVNLRGFPWWTTWGCPHGPHEITIPFRDARTPSSRVRQRRWHLREGSGVGGPPTKPLMAQLMSDSMAWKNVENCGRYEEICLAIIDAKCLLQILKQLMQIIETHSPAPTGTRPIKRFPRNHWWKWLIWDFL